jgi:hypothetical protein
MGAYVLCSRQTVPGQARRRYGTGVERWPALTDRKAEPLDGNRGRGAVVDSLRCFLARHLFSLLQGVTFADWWRLLARNRFAVDPPYWPRAAQLTLASLANSALARLEERRFGPRIDKVQVEPPLFILGHYRSGTTQLHKGGWFLALTTDGHR